MKQQLSHKERIRYQSWRDRADERRWSKVCKEDSLTKEFPEDE